MLNTMTVNIETKNKKEAILDEEVIDIIWAKIKIYKKVLQTQH